MTAVVDPHAGYRIPLGGKRMALVGRKHPALHTPAVELDRITVDTMKLALKLRSTVVAANGMSIAAPQVGVGIRLVVGRDGLALCNPVLELAGDQVTDVERCLSLPGRRYLVERATEITVTGVLITGDDHTFTCDGDIARMWQHELDHLDGILISERWPEAAG